MVRNFVLLLLISILFISCLDVESEITIGDNGTGQWMLKYRIPQEVLYITPGNELSGFNYFPSNEKGVIERINSIPGLVLIDISSRETVDFVEINTLISFTSTDLIESFFNNYIEEAILNIDSGNRGEFVITIKTPFRRKLDSDTLSIISALYSKSVMNITVDLPGIVTESSAGLLAENPNRANFEFRFLDLLLSEEPLQWRVNYE